MLEAMRTVTVITKPLFYLFESDNVQNKLGICVVVQLHRVAIRVDG